MTKLSSREIRNCSRLSQTSDDDDINECLAQFLLSTVDTSIERTHLGNPLPRKSTWDVYDALYKWVDPLRWPGSSTNVTFPSWHESHNSRTMKWHDDGFCFCDLQSELIFSRDNTCSPHFCEKGKATSALFETMPVCEFSGSVLDR